jgi:hypothetical protein
MYRLVAPVSLDHFAIRFNSCVSITCRPSAVMTLFCCSPSSEHRVGAQLPDRQVEGSGDGDPESDDQLLGAEEAVRF